MNINIYNPYVRREMELYHHGIEGQKWGKRNGPPYPLAPGDHSAAEKRAKSYKKELNKLSKQVDEAIVTSAEKAIKAEEIEQKLLNTTIKKGSKSKKARKLNDKYNELMEQSKEAEDEKKRLNDKIFKICKQLDSEGFEFTGIAGEREITRGRNIAALILTSGLFGWGDTYRIKNLRFDVQVRDNNKSKSEKSRDEKGNKASLDDVFEEQERNEQKSTKSEKKPKIQIPAENSDIMKRMRSKIEKSGLDSLTDSDWDALGWTEDMVGTDEEIELLNRLHL